MMLRTSPSNTKATLIWDSAILLSVLAVWQMWANSSISIRLLVSSPSLIVQYLVIHTSEVVRSFLWTGMESLTGLFIAISFAIVFGIVCVYQPQVGRIGFPFLVASQVIPIICLAPMIILLFGPGQSGKVFLSALVAFFPLLTNLIGGIASVPSAPLEVMKIMAAPRWPVIVHVIVPHSVDQFFAGLRIAAPLSVIGAIVAEFNGAETGVGKDIFIAAKRLEPELMMSGILSGALLSACIYAMVYITERQLGAWYWER